MKNAEENHAAKEMNDALKNMPAGLDRARIVFRCKPGREWNPLLDYPRNAPCFCDNGQKLGAKFKHCCMHLVPRTIAARSVREMKDLVARAKEEHECKKKSLQQKTS